jgi:hypothetical protein
MNILVVSGCSGDKQFDDFPIGCDAIDSTSRDEMLGEYSDYMSPLSKCTRATSMNASTER